MRACREVTIIVKDIGADMPAEMETVLHAKQF